MTAILGLLTSRLTGPLASAAAVVLLTLLVSARCTLAEVRGDLATEKTAHVATNELLTTCRTNLATSEENGRRFEADIVAQNRRVAELAADAEDAAKRADALRVTAANEVAKFDSARTALLNKQLSTDECTAMRELVRMRLP